MYTLLSMVGLPEPQLPSLILMLVLIGLSALLLGWISDLILGQAAFGIFLNSLIVLVGAFLGAWLWQRYGVPTRLDPAALKAGIALGSGLISLLVLSMVLP